MGRPICLGLWPSSDSITERSMFMLTLWFSWQKDVKAEMPGVGLRNNDKEDQGACRIPLVLDGHNWIAVLKIPLKCAEMLNVKRGVGYF